ncbi:MAG: DUF366 family protein [Bdellovibrionaceae bacterium]|jgi:uncharacterized protein|nr:DUF366 family protein [Pseudobdellovibrionaceae bacterium]
MKSLWVEEIRKYDGADLKSLFAYLNFEVLGDSIVGFQGPCDVGFGEMVDGEDLLAKSAIKSDSMVHFIVEKFDVQLFSAVALQRIMSDICICVIRDLSDNKAKAVELRRQGDDIYSGAAKLNISIATVSPASSLIHYGVNILNEGTPVQTTCLQDFSVDPEKFSKTFMDMFVKEVDSIIRATQKVKWVK